MNTLETIKMNAFTVLRWPMPDSLRHFCPVSIKILKFEKRDVICISFGSRILIYDNVELCKFQNGNDSPEHVYLLSVEGTIVDILQLGEVVGVFNRLGLYILKSKDKSAMPSPVKGIDSTQQMESLELKLHMKMHQVLALGALNSGFVLVKKKSGKLYVDVYKSGLRMVPVEKKFSVQLPQFVHNDVSCILTSVLFEELDPILGSLLVEDIALIKSQVIFVGLGCGQVYCIPVVMESKILPSPKILYSSTQSIKQIVCLKDEQTQLYSHMGVFLEGSIMLHITSFMQKLKYHMIYLPASVETYCLVKDGIIVADGIDLSYSKLCMNNERKITLENKIIGVKGICAVCPVPNSEFILAITHYLTLYCICPGTVISHDRSKNFSIPPSVMGNIDNEMQHLARLKEQIILEEKVMEAISISMRDNLLQNTFTVQVQVHRMNQNNICMYKFDIVLKNTTEQDYSPDMWSLHVCLKADTLEVAETSKLEQKIRKGINIKTSITADIPVSAFTIDISCTLVAKFSEDNERDNSSWAVIPIGSLSLDISYFFFPLPISNKNNVAEDLSKIAQNYMEKDKSVEWKQVTESSEYTYLCRLLNEKATPIDIWTAVVKNSRHNFTDVHTGRELDIYVSSHLIKMTLNENCRVMLIKCSNLEVLHHVKNSLLHLLKEINPQNFVHISRDLLTKAQEMKENLPLVGEDLQLLKQEWRDTVAKHLPFI